MTTADLTTSQSNQGDAEVTPDWLAEAQQELAEVADEAREEGYPAPSERRIRERPAFADGNIPACASPYGSLSNDGR